MIGYGLFIKVLGFPFHNPESPGRAFAQAGAQAVAVFFGHQTGLSVHKLNGALSAGRHALTATVTEFIIDFNNFSTDFHMCLQQKLGFKRL